MEVITLRELFHPNIDQMNLSTILHAMGDPIRLNNGFIINAYKL